MNVLAQESLSVPKPSDTFRKFEESLKNRTPFLTIEKEEFGSVLHYIEQEKNEEDKALLLIEKHKNRLEVLKREVKVLNEYVSNETGEAASHKETHQPKGNFLEDSRKGSNDKKSLRLEEQERILQERSEKVEQKRQDVLRKQALLNIRRQDNSSLSEKSIKQEAILSQQLQKIESQNKLLHAQISKLNSQRLIIFLSIGFLFLNAGTVIYLIGSNRRNRKAMQKLDEQRKSISAQNSHLKALIANVEEKKRLIEEKNKEIEDSIVYAHYIQNALLPLKNELSFLFPSHVLYFKSAQTISGSFYYFKKIGHKSVLAIGSSSFPGVPGAFISMISIETLNECEDPKDINAIALLKELETRIKIALPAYTSDTVDVALICFNHLDHTLEAIGANIWMAHMEAQTTNWMDYKPSYPSIGVKKLAFNKFPISLKAQKGDRFLMANNGLLKHLPLQTIKSVLAGVPMSGLESEIQKSIADINQKEDWVLIGIEI